MLLEQWAWKPGDKSKLARYINKPPKYISHILHRKKSPHKYMALRLEAATRELFGIAIPWQEWLFNCESTHPAFHGPPSTSCAETQSFKIPYPR